MDFFSPEVASPTFPATKEKIATLLYLGYPSNATNLKEHWKIDDSRAIYLTQQSVWQFVRGRITDYLKDYAYEYDLHYYAANLSSPYLGEGRYSGSVILSGDTLFKKNEGMYKTGIIKVDGNYTGSFNFDSLPKEIKIYDADNGQEITDELTVGMKIYFIHEGNLTPGYQIELNYNYDTTEFYYLRASDSSNQDLVGLDVKNNYGVLTLAVQENKETIDIPVIKKWVGNAAQSATIRLFADSVEKEAVNLTADTKWQHTFSNLPKYNQATGDEINYSIKEDAIEGYSSVITGNANSGFTVTNTIIGKTSVAVTKKWIGPAAKSVTINLLADGKQVYTQVLNEKNNWKYTFDNLEKYKDGQEIKYTIEEVAIDGYSSVISGNSVNGFVVTNTNTETINIPVNKKWVGNAAQSATVRLFADDVEINSIELTESNNWQHTFSGLPKYNQQNGNEINYSIKEDQINGYNSAITGSAESGFTVTNTKIVGKLEITKTDIADGTLLPNAGFRIYDENKNVIAEGRTDDQGIVIFELGYGKYYYQEFDAPEGYIIDETLFPFEIKTNGEIVKAEMTNTKIESDGEEPEAPETPSNPSTSVEPEESVEIEETNDSNDVSYNTENNTLPKTGGNNSIIYLLLGGVLSLAGFRIFNIRYKSKK